MKTRAYHFSLDTFYSVNTTNTNVNHKIVAFAVVEYFLFWLWCVNSILISNNKNNATPRIFLSLLQSLLDAQIYFDALTRPYVEIGLLPKNFCKKNGNNRKCIVIAVTRVNTLILRFGKKKSLCKQKIYLPKNPNEFGWINKTLSWSDFIGCKHKCILISFILCIYFLLRFLRLMIRVIENVCHFS